MSFVPLPLTYPINIIRCEVNAPYVFSDENMAILSTPTTSISSTQAVALVPRGKLHGNDQEYTKHAMEVEGASTRFSKQLQAG
ncbi:hypothetical protein CRG98_004860 [Punica granatum]|uniref:Uncharacterized protein n=1 Tax=Punica granatum TaxID=22663 RepID=A0A2I0L229_PUNGR|nr:hypothetical protein CRG98_004860 [Punica granatum]